MCDTIVYNIIIILFIALTFNRFTSGGCGTGLEIYSKKYLGKYSKNLKVIKIFKNIKIYSLYAYQNNIIIL